MDPVTLAIGLGVVFGQLAGRAADITLDKALETLIFNYGAEKVKLREAEAKALAAALAAARRAGGAEVGTRLGRALNKIKDNRGLAARVAASIVEMTSEDQRAPILKAYLQIATGAQPHVPVNKDAALAEFEKIAAAFPIFRLASNKAV